MSYYRDCKKCGRRIQLRQMPNGHWVAFEGFDTIHNCKKKPVKSDSPKTKPVKEESSKIDFLSGFTLGDSTTGGERKEGQSLRKDPKTKGDNRPTKEEKSTDLIDFLRDFDLKTSPAEGKRLGTQTSQSTKLNSLTIAKETAAKTKLIDDAILNKRILTILYCDRNMEITMRDIEPQSRQSNLLKAYCRLRNDLRSFVIDNIQSITVNENAGSAQKGNTSDAKSGIEELFEHNYKPVPIKGSSGCFGTFLMMIIFSYLLVEKLIS